MLRLSKIGTLAVLRRLKSGIDAFHAINSRLISGRP